MAAAVEYNARHAVLQETTIEIATFSTPVSTWLLLCTVILDLANEHGEIILSLQCLQASGRLRLCQHEGMRVSYRVLSTVCAMCRVLDVYTGKTAKLNDTALQTASNTSAFLRYNKADFNLTDLGGAPPLVLPAPEADWGNFSLINLPGKNTFPVITTAMIISSQDLSQLGECLDIRFISCPVGRAGLPQIVR